MRKIPTLFRRDPEDPRRLLEEVHPECGWVLDGEGTPTRKYDGTCVAWLDLGQDPDWSSRGLMWWVRQEVKASKPDPHGFHLVDEDPATGKRVGWFPAARDGRWKQLQEAAGAVSEWAPGTYELVGPKVNGNPERRDGHVLIAHADAEVLTGLPDELALDTLRGYLLRVLEPAGVEGIVWHHPDGRMAKLKVRDVARS